MNTNNLQDYTFLFVVKGSALNRGMNTGIENLAWGLAPFCRKIHILAGGKRPKNHEYQLPENIEYHFTGGTGKPGDHIESYQKLSSQFKFHAVIGWIKLISPLTFFERKINANSLFIANEGMVHKPISLFGKGSAFRKLLSFPFKLSPLGRNRFYWSNHLPTRRIDAVVAISEAVSENVQMTYQIPKEKIQVIPRSVDTDFFQPDPRKDLGALSNPPRFLYTGNIIKAKGLNDVAAALDLIDQPVDLVLCGKDMGYLKEMEKRICSSKSGHRLIWKGQLYPQKLLAELQSADCFLFCSSSSEGLGKSLLEAMSCRIPVITSDLPAFRNLIEHEKNGLVAPAKDPQSIAQAMNRYLSDPALRIHCGQNARHTIQRLYHKEVEITAWTSTLTKLITTQTCRHE